jgi:cobalt-zinc-cadmium efflux system membrane fusion protein
MRVGTAIMDILLQAVDMLKTMVGDIAQDTENVTHIIAPAAGTLQSMKVKVGDVVDQGTPLAQVLTNEGNIIEIVSPSHGIVMAQYAKDNESVDVISSLVTIANPDLLRASFNVYEKDLAGIKAGLRVIVKSMAYPDKEFEGELVFISPQVDVKTRAIRVRANVKNEEHLLKFGMYVTGTILVPISEESLLLPEEAVQDMKGETVVFVPHPGENEEFQIREVSIGRKMPGFVEVLEGLSPNEDVVGQGSFYLKSELLKGELGHGHAH